MQHFTSIFSSPKSDIVAGVVVFLVALPLCLGIALACGVPPVSGLVAGIVGGLVVPLLSRSALSVSGPAAGLTSIVLLEVENLGGLAPFLTAVMLAGVLQMGFGLLRTGRFSALVPSAVIKGMLAAIGITIIIKQIPVVFGLEADLTDMPKFLREDFADHVSFGSLVIAAVSLAILYGWKKTPLGKIAFLSPALIVVVAASLMGVAFAGVPLLALEPGHFVSVPLGGFSALKDAVPRPDFGMFLDGKVWIAAVTIAIVASIETLLSVQAVDRLDPLRRHSPPDRELVAQGTANLISGFLGGLPLTAVIVRSGANISAGGRERLSSLVHGLLLLVAVVFAGALLNLIPLAALAAVLIQVGLNLCKPALFTSQWKLGFNQFLPFAITVVAVLATDLLKGVITGIVVGVIFVIRQNATGTLQKTRDEDGALHLRFTRDATFVTKPALVTTLDDVDDGESVIIEATGEYIDQDVKEALAGFVEDAHNRKINVKLVGIDLGGASAGGGH